MIITEYENYHESKQHGVASFPYNTYLCSIPLLFKQVPLHWHEELEIVYIKKGEGVVTVDLNSYHVTAGTFVFVLPGQLHSIEQFGNREMDYENIIFHPGMLMAGSMDICGQEYLQPLLSGELPIPTVFPPGNPLHDQVAAPIDACDEICKTMEPGYELYIKSMLFQLFYILRTRCVSPTEGHRRRRNLERIKPVLKYVENHYSERITIADIAAVAGFSESHFMRHFKEMTETSFVDFLKEYRLTMASRLLQATEDTILNIAEAVGFDNLSYFNRAFKAKYGVTPGEWRKGRG